MLRRYHPFGGITMKKTYQKPVLVSATRLQTIVAKPS